MTEIDNGIDKKIVEKNIVFLFTSTLNKKNNEYKNNITMNLGQCENLLKNDYNISDNDSLYILQIISEENGMKIPKIEYEIYYPLYNSYNLTKLNLTSCQDTKIEISIAVSIDEDLDKYNSSSDYYNDICSKTTSESGTDISLKDRRNEFVDNNMSLCEENCELIDYDYTKEKAKCSCDVKLSIPSNYDIKFNKKDFLKSFIDIKNIDNLNIMKCYKIVFKIKDLIKNYGFFIISFIIVLYFITLIIFWAYSYNKLKNDINIMISLLKINETTIIKNDIKKITKKKKKKKVKRKKKIKNNNTNSNINNLNNKIELKNNYDENIEKRNYSGLITQNLEDKSINIMKNDILLNINKNDIYAKSLLEEKDFEINSLDYEEAFKLDHRNYFQYYISLLKYNHPILFSFAPFKDYNPRVIKMFLFFFSFCLDFSINALFFNDDTMNKIYEDKGKFNFLYQIPQILYSTLISRFIDALIKKFGFISR